MYGSLEVEKKLHIKAIKWLSYIADVQRFEHRSTWRVYLMLDAKESIYFVTLYQLQSFVSKCKLYDDFQK
jgi:hypothetical protein